jgi:hypothetical protein
MKIKEIVENFDAESELKPEDVVRIFKAVIQSGKSDPKLSDYIACPNCGGSDLCIYQVVRTYAKGTNLACKSCDWAKLGDDWSYIDEKERENLVKRYGEPAVKRM